MQAMRRLGDRNDWWDWGVILLVVAGGTIILWASVWLMHSHFAAAGGVWISAVGAAPAMRRADGPKRPCIASFPAIGHLPRGVVGVRVGREGEPPVC
jgi:hypothetical protein